MQPNPKALEEIVRKSYDDEDLAEEFTWFCEDCVELDSREDFLRTTMELPVRMRRLFLALNADIVISGDGFSGYIDPSSSPALYLEAAEGFRMIGHEDIASILLEAADFINSAPPEVRESTVEMDRLTGNIHGRYFRVHKDVHQRIGAQVRELGEALLK